MYISFVILVLGPFFFLQKEAMKKKLAIQKQKHGLLQKQIEQQKVLFSKLESNKNISVADKATIIKVYLCPNKWFCGVFNSDLLNYFK